MLFFNAMHEERQKERGINNNHRLMNKQNVCPATYIVNAHMVQMGSHGRYTVTEALNYSLITWCQSE